MLFMGDLIVVYYLDLTNQPSDRVRCTLYHVPLRDPVRSRAVPHLLPVLLRPSHLPPEP
jgi:hypothetical protein